MDLDSCNKTKINLRLKEKEDEIKEKLSASNTTLIASNINVNDNSNLHEMVTTQNEFMYDIQYTSDLLSLYNNLNQNYRNEAFKSLDFVKSIQAMTEFKIKLLFSVVVVI